MKSNDLIEVAVIGKSVGLKGELKLHLKSDFPEQFKKNSLFYLSKQTHLTVEYYNNHRGVVKFKEINTREESQKYINKTLFSTIEDTKENCKLEDGEFFWFDIIGCEIKENFQTLGVVTKIEQYGINDYLVVEINPKLSYKIDTFFIPYIDKYVLEVDICKKQIFTKDAKDILENS